MTRLYILRHGQTEWNRDNNRYCGCSDIGLSEEGHRQAENVSRWIEKLHVDYVYSSPMIRAAETAAYIAARHQIEVQMEAGIREIDYGKWEGLTLDEIQTAYPDNWSKWFENPGNTRAGTNGESASQVFFRFERTIRELCDRHKGANVVIVSHSAASRMFLSGVLGMPMQAYRTLTLHNTGVCVLDVLKEGEYKLIQFNAQPEVI